MMPATEPVDCPFQSSVLSGDRPIPIAHLGP